MFQTLQKLSGLVSFSCLRASRSVLLLRKAVPAPDAELTVWSIRVIELSRLMLLWSDLNIVTTALLPDVPPHASPVSAPAGGPLAPPDRRGGHAHWPGPAPWHSPGWWPALRWPVPLSQTLEPLARKCPKIRENVIMNIGHYWITLTILLSSGQRTFLVMFH